MLTTDKQTFIDRLIHYRVLRFGDFTLKSGRLSPYFFDMGAVCSGPGLKLIGEAYADQVMALPEPIHCLFGPAYKGIPLVASTSMSLHDKYQQTIPYCFNRKEEKAHGEGGNLVGSPLTGRIAMIDDVITAGSTVAEITALLAKRGVSLSAIIIALDRQEKNSAGEHAVSAISERFHIPIVSIITLSDVIAYFDEKPGFHVEKEQILAYQASHGCMT